MSTAPSPAPSSSEFADRGSSHLLGLIAYASLSAFDQLAQGSSDADDLTDALLLARLAAARLDHMQLVENALSAQHIDVVEAMGPFRRPVDEFHKATAPTQWSETLLKLHLTQGLAADFADLTGANLPENVRALVSEAVRAGDLDERVTERLREAIAARPADAGRLSLFGRRVLGEALGQAQRVAARDTELTSLLTGSEPGSTEDLARISQTMGELGTRHAQRIDGLGLFG